MAIQIKLSNIWQSRQDFLIFGNLRATEITLNHALQYPPDIFSTSLCSTWTCLTIISTCICSTWTCLIVISTALCSTWTCLIFIIISTYICSTWTCLIVHTSMTLP